MEHKCEECNAPLSTQGHKRFAKVCSATCQHARKRRRYREKHPRSRPIGLTQCVSCNESISEDRQRRGAKFCSERCRAGYQGRAYAELNPVPRRGSPGVIATGSVGAAAEMAVCADLLMRGYAVFRAVSQACPCDLAVLRDGRLLRIEVKTGYRTASGGVQYPKLSKEHFDVLAIVMRHNREIIYEPAEF